MTSETHPQMLRRHRQERKVAAEQHAIRLRTMRERHFSELMQVVATGKPEKGEKA